MYAHDSQGRLVNFIEKDLFVTMKQGKLIKDLKVTADSQVVGDRTAHKFTFTNPVPVSQTDSFVVIFPT